MLVPGLYLASPSCEGHPRPRRPCVVDSSTIRPTRGKRAGLSFNLRDPAPKSKRNVRLPACLAVEAGSVSVESTQLAPNMSPCAVASASRFCMAAK